jgi:ribosomal protein L37AE/L43A
MFACPSCGSPLTARKGSDGLFWSCLSCRGRSSTVGQLRRFVNAVIGAAEAAAKATTAAR